jgi:hypothetical protein
VLPVSARLFLSFSIKHCLLVSCQKNGNCPTLRQSQRAGLLGMLPITDLFRFYHLYPKYLHERCIYNRLIEHIGEKLHHRQFGFLKGKSTTSQFLQVLHDMYIGNKLDNKCQVDTLYLNFAKAFDKVNHELLLLKLKRFGISGNLLSWLRDYLSGRYQRVTVLGETSNPLPVISGVPQAHRDRYSDHYFSWFM